jgi:hypothetical protein
MAFGRKSYAKSSPKVPPPPLPGQLVTLPRDETVNPIEAESTIGQDLTIEGQAIIIRCKGRLRVNGDIQAQLDCVDLLVGQQAVIERIGYRQKSSCVWACQWANLR